MQEITRQLKILKEPTNDDPNAYGAQGRGKKGKKGDPRGGMRYPNREITISLPLMAAAKRRAGGYLEKAAQRTESEQSEKRGLGLRTIHFDSTPGSNMAPALSWRADLQTGSNDESTSSTDNGTAPIVRSPLSPNGVPVGRTTLAAGTNASTRSSNSADRPDSPPSISRLPRHRHAGQRRGKIRQPPPRLSQTAWESPAPLKNNEKDC